MLYFLTLVTYSIIMIIYVTMGSGERYLLIPTYAIIHLLLAMLYMDARQLMRSDFYLRYIPKIALVSISMRRIIIALITVSVIDLTIAVGYLTFSRDSADILTGLMVGKFALYKAAAVMAIGLSNVPITWLFGRYYPAVNRYR